jgi:hypothetical protein
MKGYLGVPFCFNYYHDLVIISVAEDGGSHCV